MRILRIVLSLLIVAAPIVLYKGYEPLFRPDTAAIHRILKDLAEYGAKHQLVASCTDVSSPDRVVRQGNCMKKLIYT